MRTAGGRGYLEGERSSRHQRASRRRGLSEAGHGPRAGRSFALVRAIGGVGLHLPSIKGDYFVEEAEGAGVGDVGEALFVAGSCGGGFLRVAEDFVGYGEECLEFGIEFGSGDFGDGEAAREDVEGGGLRGGEGSVGPVGFEGIEEPRDECINLIVGPAGVFCEADDADGVGLYVVGDGADLGGGGYDYVAVLGTPAGDEGAFEAGEGAADDFDFVAVEEVDVGGVVVGEPVGVGAGYDAEGLDVGIGDGDIASGARGTNELRAGKLFFGGGGGDVASGARGTNELRDDGRFFGGGRGSDGLRADGRFFGGRSGTDGLRDGGGACGGDSFCGGEGIGMAEHEGEAAAGGGEAFDVFERTGDEDVVE